MKILMIQIFLCTTYENQCAKLDLNIENSSGIFILILRQKMKIKIAVERGCKYPQDALPAGCQCDFVNAFSHWQPRPQTHFPVVFANFRWCFCGQKKKKITPIRTFTIYWIPNTEHLSVYVRTFVMHIPCIYTYIVYVYIKCHIVTNRSLVCVSMKKWPL